MCDEDWAHVNSRSHAHMAHQRAATDANGRACRIAVMFGVALLLLAAQWSGASVGPPPPPGLCAPAGPAGNANCLPCLKWHCHAMMKDRSTCEDCLTHHLDYAAKANCTAAQEATLCSGLAPSPSPSPPGPPPPSPTPAGNCSAAMAVRCPKKGDETDFDTLRLILCITDPAHHHTPLPCTEAEKAAYCIPPPCPGPLPTPPPPAPPKPPPSPGKPLGSLVATPAQESVQACSDGSAARNQFLWNPLTDGRDDALLTGVPGFSTQRACRTFPSPTHVLIQNSSISVLQVARVGTRA